MANKPRGKYNERSCGNCNSTFMEYDSQKRTFCSMVCRSQNSTYRKQMSIAAKSAKPRYGKENPNWRGGTCEARHLDMSRNVYKEWRKAVYERDGYACVECGVAGDGKNLNADHIKPYSTHPELRYELSNGRTLCKECHRATDTYGWKMFNMRKGNVCQV